MLPRALNMPMWAGFEDTSGEVIELRPLKVKFRYQVADPWAVVLDFGTGGQGWVRWVLARDLLIAGLDLPTGPDTIAVGAGDVQVGPDPELSWRVWIDVASPSGAARFAFKRDDLQAALAKTEALVPTGHELI